jgi:hypothetical protein
VIVVNEFGSKPPDSKVQPVAKQVSPETAEWRTKFGLDGRPPPATDHPAPHPPANANDRRTTTERALDAKLPIATVHREVFERSPVREFERSLVQQGFPAQQMDNLRAALRYDPELCTALAGSKAMAQLLRDFARVGTVPFERYAMPKSPEVDALVHQAVGKQPGEYVSQHDLDELLKTVADNRSALLHKGLSEKDVDRLRSYLIRDTGRVLRSDLPQPVMTSDGFENASAEDAVQHDRWRMVDATADAPLGTTLARWSGADLDTVENVGRAVTLVHDALAAFVMHTAAVRSGIAAAERPAAAPAHAPEVVRGVRDAGSYADELLSIRDRAYQLALADAHEIEDKHGQRLNAAQFGTRVHVNFGELANESVRQGRLPQNFVVNVQSRLGQDVRGLDAWDKSTGIGFDVTTATQRSVESHEKHVGVPATDGTMIKEYLPLVYPPFKQTKQTLGWE